MVISNGGAVSLTRHCRASAPVAEWKMWQAGGLTQVKYFHESDTDSSIPPGGDGSIGARRKRGQNGSFTIVSRRQAGSLDGCTLLVFPIVVSLQQQAIAIPQFEGG